MNVTLHFNLKIQVDDAEDIDFLGKALAEDIIGEFFNGEDVLEVEYTGCDK